MDATTGIGDPLVARAPSKVLARGRAYVALTKPRIIELLLITTVPTMFVASKHLPSAVLVVLTILGGALAAGGANALNMVYDRDIDAVMERTKGRPLVTGAVTPVEAVLFAILLELGSEDIILKRLADGHTFAPEAIEKLVPPKKGDKHVMRVIREILGYSPRYTGTNLRLALETLSKVAKRRSVIGDERVGTGRAPGDGAGRRSTRRGSSAGGRSGRSRAGRRRRRFPGAAGRQASAGR